MDMSYEETNNNDTRFNVKHYRVRFEKRRENPIRFVVNVLSYAIFIFLMLVGATLLIYVADIKLREAKGDFSQPKFNAYVVLTGSMLPTIQVKDIVVTKKVSDDKLKVGDIITFLTPDQRFNGISITHRIVERYYDEKENKYYYRTRGDNNNIADDALITNDNITGKVILKIPKLGYIQDLLASKSGLIIVIIIPSLAIISYDIVRVVKRASEKSRLKN